jgi:hypothetical protein
MGLIGYKRLTRRSLAALGSAIMPPPHILHLSIAIHEPSHQL